MAQRQRRRRRQGAALVLSGASWVSQFPTSKDVEDLSSPFKDDVKEFLAALSAAGATVEISATYRPKERAFLMHYAFAIARKGLNPTAVPAVDGIDIDWVHRKADGTIALSASKDAAEDMVDGYGIVYEPALNSNHTARLAIDMTISWSGTLTIKNAAGKSVKIAGTPRSGQNATLIKVGASYGVIKLKSDPPHWSEDGG